MVCRVLSSLGYHVYDCDTRAKELMDSSAAIKSRIAHEIDSQTVKAGAIDRKRLSHIVFADRRKLELLNSIVHGAVREDIRFEATQCKAPIMFIETAILYESGIDRMVSEVWTVDAPVELRVERVKRRDPHLNEDDIRKRIDAQTATVPGHPHECVYNIINDGVTPLLPQLLSRTGL